MRLLNPKAEDLKVNKKPGGLGWRDGEKKEERSSRAKAQTRQVVENNGSSIKLAQELFHAINMGIRRKVHLGL